jgi:hypothetical protein
VAVNLTAQSGIQFGLLHGLSWFKERNGEGRIPR